MNAKPLPQSGLRSKMNNQHQDLMQQQNQLFKKPSPSALRVGRTASTDSSFGTPIKHQLLLSKVELDN